MTVDFIVATRIDFEDDMRLILAGYLSRAFESIGAADEETSSTVEDLADYISTTSHRSRGYGYEHNDETLGQHIIIGFTLELPDDVVEDPALLIDAFMEELRGEDRFYHVLKFADTLLQEELQERAAELFALEMKLRRALSLMYLDAYRDGGNPYQLLVDETAKPTKEEGAKEDEMQNRGENQFFYLTFGQYRILNKRPHPTGLQNLVQVVRDMPDYEGFRDLLTSNPIRFAPDAALLAALTDKMEVIERMRNCVAHNRQPSEKLRGHYQTVLGPVNQLLDDYLANAGLPSEDATEQTERHEPLPDHALKPSDASTNNGKPRRGFSLREMLRNFFTRG